MIKFLTIFCLLALLISCDGNDHMVVAKQYCNCRQIEKDQGALQGNKCFEEWDKKYGKISLDEFTVEEQKEYLKTTQDCNVIE